ncbi:DUF805 domain-containing protein [Streptomyces sp. PA03-6a]|nr:DUF805 domain-containing protein [Streptomyces sp. PA03-6a]
MHWYVDVLKKYAVFGGRARRTEYWMFALFNVVISIVLVLVGRAIDFNFLQSVYALAVLLPGLGVAVRRLHDTGRSGWWILIALVPVVGAIVLLVFFCTEGQPSENQYGANPKFSGAPA